MSVLDDPSVTRRARGQIARRRGALIGLILIILGAWGALIPFVGPYFHYAYSPDHAWRWTASRGWLEVLPGAATAFGGLLVLTSNSRATAVLGAWLAAAGGAWFAVGTSFVPIFHTGAVGAPAGDHATVRVLEAIGFFYGLGVVIVFFAATASGRLSVRSLADIHLAQRELDDEARASIRSHDTGTAQVPAAVKPARTQHPNRDAEQTRQHTPVIVEPASSETVEPATSARPRQAGVEGYRPVGDGATALADPEQADQADLAEQSHTRRWNPLHHND
jgi:hypothetical protein